MLIHSTILWMGQQSRLSTDSHSAQVERLRSTPSNVESLPKFDPNRNSMTSAPHAFTIVNHRGSSQPKDGVLLSQSRGKFSQFAGLLRPDSSWKGRTPLLWQYLHLWKGQLWLYNILIIYIYIIYWLYIYIIIYIYICVLYLCTYYLMISLANKGSGRDIQSTDAVHVTLQVRFGETSDINL